ncbi:catalase [Enterovibrio baiacu]|uniref:catalase n=1 Tax=Enterovibrio baiacu TaxID=2491023 RepID=UPI003D0D72FA
MKKTKLSMMLMGLIAFTAEAAISPQLPGEMIDAFEGKFGVTEGKRRNHTKGFCFKGQLIPNESLIANYSDSAIFKAPSGVIGRFSHSGGNNNAPDDKYGELGIGLSIVDLNGDNTRMALNTLDFFPVSTPDAFLALNQAKVKGKDAVAKMKQSHPELAAFSKHMAKRDKKVKPYEDHAYNGINTFFFVNAKGEKTPFRWVFEPTMANGVRVETHPDFFFDNIQASLENGGVSWDMTAVLANPSDDINNAAVKWTGPHQTITPVTLMIEKVATESEGQCDTINFDPLVLAKGIEPSSDPILLARSPVYAVSFGKRLTEKAAK